MELYWKMSTKMMKSKAEVQSDTIINIQINNPVIRSHKTTYIASLWGFFHCFKSMLENILDPCLFWKFGIQSENFRIYILLNGFRIRHWFLVYICGALNVMCIHLEAVTNCITSLHHLIILYSVHGTLYMMSMHTYIVDEWKKKTASYCFTMTMIFFLIRFIIAIRHKA